MAEALRTKSEAELEGYILMDRILPPQHPNVLLRNSKTIEGAP